MLALLQSADIFVLNSSYEGLPHILVEALGLGVPAIVADAGGTTEVVQDSVNGLVVPVHDTPALADALERLIEDSGLRARIIEGATRVAEKFSQDTMLAETAAFFTTHV